MNENASALTPLQSKFLSMNENHRRNGIESPRCWYIFSNVESRTRHIFEQNRKHGSIFSPKQLITAHTSNN